MRTATLGLVVVVLVGFLASDATAQHRGAGPVGPHGARVSSGAYHGQTAYGGYHSIYRQPDYGHGYHGYDRYRAPHGHYGYRAPVIVAPPACVHPRVHDVYRPNYYPQSTFYYGGRNFGIGVSF